jgi:hypothetical protein
VLSRMECFGSVRSSWLILTGWPVGCEPPECSWRVRRPQRSKSVRSRYSG